MQESPSQGVYTIVKEPSSNRGKVIRVFTEKLIRGGDEAVGDDVIDSAAEGMYSEQQSLAQGNGIGGRFPRSAGAVSIEDSTQRQQSKPPVQINTLIGGDAEEASSFRRHKASSSHEFSVEDRDSPTRGEQRQGRQCAAGGVAGDPRERAQGGQGGTLVPVPAHEHGLRQALHTHLSCAGALWACRGATPHGATRHSASSPASE